MTNKQNIISRRSRPAKPPLSRERIVSTALDILAREGLQGLSLRRVATALDTGAASLYVYIANLNELHALMLDQAFSDFTFEEEAPPLSWRDRLKAFLLSYLKVVHSMPGLAQLAMSTIASGPNTLRIWELLLGLLKEGAVEDARAAWGVDLLLLYVTAIAAEQSIRDTKGQDMDSVRDAISSAAQNRFPLVHAFSEAFFAGDGDTRAQWALDVIISGIVCCQSDACVPTNL